MKLKIAQQIILTCIILIGITNCVPTKKLCQKCPTKDSIVYTETVTENPYYTIPDTAYYDLLFSCDSNYNVILRELEDANNGMRTETIIKEVPKYIEDGKKVMQLRVSLKAISDSVLIKNKIIEKLRSEVRTIKVEVEKPVKYVPKFYKYLLASCIIFVILVIGYIYLRIKGKTILGLIK